MVNIVKEQVQRAWSGCGGRSAHVCSRHMALEPMRQADGEVLRANLRDRAPHLGAHAQALWADTPAHTSQFSEVAARDTATCRVTGMAQLANVSLRHGA